MHREDIGRCSDIHEVVVTDTVPLPENYDSISRGKVVQVSVATIIADTIDRMHRKESLREVVAYDPAMNEDSSHLNG